MRTSRKKFAQSLALLSGLIIAISLWQTARSRDTTFGTKPADFAAKVSSRPNRPGRLKGVERKVASIEWFMSQRTYGLGHIPPDAEFRAVEHVRQRMIPELAAKGIHLQQSTAGQLDWQAEGPGNLGGRLRGVLAHPNNSNILYVGSVSGGVWKSTNGGVSWFPTTENMATLNISALVMKPGDPNTIYAGTGEGHLISDGLPGRGLLKTTDGGDTWKRVHGDQGLNSPFILELAVSPAAPEVVYAAGRKAVPLNSTRPSETVPDPGVNAIFKSMDSGETWQDMTTGKGIEHNPEHTLDDCPVEVVVSPLDANVVFATFGLREASGGMWKSTDGGQAWSRLTNGLPNPDLPNQGYNRIELAMAPSNPDVLYASFSYLKKPGDTADLPNSAMLGIWKTTNGGQSWTQMTTPLTSNGSNRNRGLNTALGSQGFYANAIIVYPTDPSIVFVGGLDIYRSIDGGISWSQVSMWIPPGNWENPENLPYVHADHHVFTFDRSTNPPTLYNGSDGGVARSRDLGVTWEVLNNDLGVTQFYFFAVHPTNPKIMLGGTQDNGSPFLVNRGINDWFAFSTGDGGPSCFDYNDPATAYYSSYNVDVARNRFDYLNRRTLSTDYIGFTNGSNGITQEDVSGAAFFAPFEMSPNNPSVLVLGTNRLMKSTNRGDSWTALSTRVNVPIVAVAVAEGNDGIMWMATREAKIYKTEDNGATYIDVTGANLPNRFLTDIEFDPSNNRTAYLTYSGYGTPHVFKSTNAGGSWTNITNNLPDIPANTIQVHPQNPNLLFLGTDIGLFLSENGGQTWQPSTNGFPTTQVTVIELNTNYNRIFAATHGRGIYSAPLAVGTGTAELNVDAQEIAIQVKPGETATSTFNISNTGTAELNFNITASGPTSAASLYRAVMEPYQPGATASSSLQPPPFVVAQAAKVNSKPPAAHTVPADNTPKTSTAVRGGDLLILDDGNDTPDNFIGLQGTAETYWCNRFIAPNGGFQLESFFVYLRTESEANPSFFVAIDTETERLGQATLALAPSQNGTWYEINPPAPLSFAGGEAFYIIIGAPQAISYPAGADANAAVPNSSYYFDPGQNRYVLLSTISGFENGAFLIRAAGTKLGGDNQPPVAKATVSTNTAKVNEAITFDASQSFDPDGQITQYAWDFGDGSTSNLKVATHAYSRAGNFSANLTVTDNQGATGQTLRILTIAPGGSNRFVVTPANGTLAAGSSQSINVVFDAQGLAEGEYQGQISITSNGGNRALPVRINVTNVSSSTVELIHDNGVPSQNYYWNNAGQGSAVRFTPPGLPAKVKEAKFYIGSIQEGNNVKLRVLADDNGKPGNTIFGPVALTLPATGWIKYDLTSANLTVNGDFYVMLEYDGTNKPHFSAESAPPLEQRSWDFDGSEWTLYEDEDYLIRAVVAYTPTSVDDRDDDNRLPKTIALSQNYPNPFNPETTIRYELPHEGNVTLVVFDLNGRYVAQLESGLKAAGQHVIRWNGRDSAGNRVPSGVYFYRLEATSPGGSATVLTKKMTVLK